MYQMKIKVITISNSNDPKPRVNTIGPDMELQSFSMLPPGKVPDMTLLHYDNVHFNLIVSKQSRLYLKTIGGKDVDERKEDINRH